MRQSFLGGIDADSSTVQGMDVPCRIFTPKPCELSYYQTVTLESPANLCWACLILNSLAKLMLEQLS
jgi:hypothetical protein